MPVVRRSRRLSKQNSVDGCGWEWESSEAIYPESDAVAKPAPATPTPLTASSTLSATNRKVIADCPAVAVFFPEVDLKRPVRTSVHNRKRNDDHIPRPPNAFLIFRSFLWANRSGMDTGADHRDVSCLAGSKWRSFTARGREPFEEVATLAKARHSELYPHYKYSPSGKKAKSLKRKAKRGGNEEARCNKVALLLMQGIQGTALEEEMEKCDISEGSASRDDSPQTLSSMPSPPSSPPSSAPFHGTDSSSSSPSPSATGLNGYVPMEQIPPLELDVGVVCKEEEKPKIIDAYDHPVNPDQCLTAYSGPLLPIPASPFEIQWEHAMKPERQQMDPTLFQLACPSTPESTLSSPVSLDSMGLMWANPFDDCSTSTDFGSSPDALFNDSDELFDTLFNPGPENLGFNVDII